MSKSVYVVTEETYPHRVRIVGVYEYLEDAREVRDEDPMTLFVTKVPFL